MRNCYLSRNYKGVDSAGNKAKTDIEHIMEEMGYVNVGLRQTRYTNTVLAFLATLAGVLKSVFSLRRDDCLVLQYPLKKYFTFVCRVAHFRGAKVVAVIHDLGSFRRRKLTVEQEIRRLGHSDYIIAHNTKMKDWLVGHGCRVPVGELEIFDYLSETVADVGKKAEKPYEGVTLSMWIGTSVYHDGTKAILEKATEELGMEFEVEINPEGTEQSW